MLSPAVRPSRTPTPTPAVRPLPVAPLGVSGALIVLVILTGLAIRATTGVTAVDLRILNAISTIQTPALTALAFGVDRLFSPPFAALIVVVAGAVVLLVTRRIRPVIVFACVAVIPWLGSEVVKQIVRRPRPDPAALTHPLTSTPASFSFPSGHTAFAVAFCLALLTVAWSTRARPYLIVAAVVIPLLTAFTRMYLGVHYLTDVVASLLLTTSAAAIVVILGGAILTRVGRHGE
ncbi:phosphatase PAP2 family protein [Leifsonia poae]|uniref:phosphatase PAP2 family protein n=1 Tax=Leifsonia poae TaxID=110933 RepID=UPI003D677627